MSHQAIEYMALCMISRGKRLPNTIQAGARLPGDLPDDELAYLLAQDPPLLMLACEPLQLHSEAQPEPVVGTIVEPQDAPIRRRRKRHHDDY